MEYGLGACARAQEKIGHVPETHRRLVDQVVALTRTVEAPGDGDLGVVLVFEGHLLGCVVVERERDLGEIMRAAGLAAAEDDVLHRPPAQVPGALLPHAPPDRIDDVRLAATVRTDNRKNVVVEVQDGSVDERLEADKLELLDLHPAWTPWWASERGVTRPHDGPTSLHISSLSTHHLYPRSLVQFKGKSSKGAIPARAAFIASKEGTARAMSSSVWHFT